MVASSIAVPRRTLHPARPAACLPPLKATKLLDQLRERIRTLRYSFRTEEAYVRWCRAFIRFHCLRHPAEMGGPEVEAFLTWLACERSVAASTHKQALSAILFLYSRVLGVQLPWMAEVGRPRVRRRLPVVLTPEELTAVFRTLHGEHLLFAKLLYGTGMRLSEGLQLRVKDLDFAHRTLVVRAGKGGKDRLVMLPQSLVPALQEQLARGHALWAADQADDRGGVEMPNALERKYPRVGHSWPWFWVFPQASHSTDPRSGVIRRHHMFDQTFQRAYFSDRGRLFQSDRGRRFSLISDGWRGRASEVVNVAQSSAIRLKRCVAKRLADVARGRHIHGGGRRLRRTHDAVGMSCSP
jgi:integron integrase